MLVFGAGGHAKVVIDIARKAGFFVVGVVDEAQAAGSEFCGASVLGRTAEIVRICQEIQCSAGVVAIGNNMLRANVVQNILDVYPQFQFVTLVHPSAVLGENVLIGEGSVIMAGAIVNPAANIGRHIIVNTKASVDHDAQIGDFTSIAPGATLGGNVGVGEHTAIGLGANVIHGVTIGKHTVVGAGALVNKALPDFVVAFGVPARVVRARVAGDRYL